jgi:molecular chaperone GrpE
MDEEEIQDAGEDMRRPDDIQVLQALQKQVAEAREEAQTNLSGWQHCQADFENYKKRKENENQELVQFAREVTVAKLLPTLDTLGQAILHMPEGVDEKWKNGLLGTLQQLDKVLAELGVKKIEAVGKRFDPNFHEAIQEVPGDEDGIVMQEFVTGYELNGKVIRPSQVSISRKDNNE